EPHARKRRLRLDPDVRRGMAGVVQAEDHAVAVLGALEAGEPDRVTREPQRRRRRWARRGDEKAEAVVVRGSKQLGVLQATEAQRVFEAVAANALSTRRGDRGTRAERPGRDLARAARDDADAAEQGQHELAVARLVLRQPLREQREVAERNRAERVLR